MREVAGDAPLKEIADRVGIDKSNVTRWKGGGRPAADFAVSFARAYGRPVTEALIAASYINSDEANLQTVKIGVSELSTLELVSELHSRIQRSENVGE